VLFRSRALLFIRAFVRMSGKIELLP